MQRHLLRTARSDEGAVAIVVALCAIVLFGFGALAVDLGNQYARARTAQTDADFAALAGAAQLPDQSAAFKAAYNYLKLNLPQDDNGAPVGDPANYTDGAPGNGEISFPTATRITIITPLRTVSFGLAGALGFKSGSVTRTATAEVRSPKKTLPFFLNLSCNVGSQVIKQAPPGQAGGTVTGCGQSSTGDFGLIDSPRLDVSSNSVSQALDLNLSLGEDHTVVPFQPSLLTPMPPATLKQNCQLTGSKPIPGGIWDNDPTLNTANCMDIDNGLGVAATTAGLVTGGNAAQISFDGRLTKKSTICPGRSDVTVLGEQINNDVLSCFLKPGYTLTDLENGTPNILQDNVLQSPRFFYVPVLNASVQPQNGFYPIVEFRGVFITDETAASSASGTDATAANGISTKSAKIQSLTVFAFPLAGLPASEGNNGPTSTYIGGTKIPVLIN
jgi:hypothetical protein